MDIDKIVKSATAIANLEFSKNVDAEAKRLTKEDDIVPVWALQQAIKSELPILIQNILISTLTDFLSELTEKKQ